MRPKAIFVPVEDRMFWLSSELIVKVRGVFESRYDSELSEDEIYEIASNLVCTLESVLRHRMSNK